MSRLIDADAFEKFIKEKYKDGESTDDIKDQMLFDLSYQPTAYDVEKVVENINNIDTRRNWNSSCEECINHTTCKEIYNEEAKTKSNHLCSQVIKKLAIKEVRNGRVE